MTTKIRKCITCNKRRRMFLVDSGGLQEQCSLRCSSCYDKRWVGAIKQPFLEAGLVSGTEAERQLIKRFETAARGS